MINTINLGLNGQPNRNHRQAASLKAGERTWTRGVRHLLPAALCALAALQVGPLAAQSPARDGSRQQLKGHLSREMANAPLVRRVPAETRLTLTVGLPVPDKPGLIAAINEIADTHSPHYRNFLTPEQFAGRFGATLGDYQSVLDWAQRNHFTATAHRNRLVVTVEGSAAAVESALNIHLHYRKRADGTEFFAPDAEPALDLSTPVAHIGGLDDFVRPLNASGSGAGGSYQGTDFRNAYAPGMTLTGAGQKIGIFMLDGFAQSDIDGYAAQTKQTFLPVQIVGTSKTTSTPGVEGTLDIEAALSMAPAAQVIAFVGEPNRTAILTNMTDRDDVKQFTSSWFWYNGTTTEEDLMLQLAAQGQSFFQATGDSGPYPETMFAKCVSGSADDRTFPAITLVGGTVLNMTGKGATYVAEKAWGSSTGGFIECNPLPDYQAGIAGSNGASGAYQNAPDVSAQAQNILEYFKGKTTNIGGTSLATPLWAGFMALVNELAANYGAPSVGFANPALYAIAAGSDYTTDFNDVTTGCAKNKSGDSYCAGVGYDLATGLGSPQHALIYALSGVQSYPLYCQGPLATSAGATPFRWAAQGAGAANPGPGECAWADRAPRGSEIQSRGGNVILATPDEVANLAAGQFAEVGVYTDPATNQLVVTQIVGLVSPPFSSSATLP